MKYKHVKLSPSSLMRMGQENNVPPGTDMLEWYLEKKAPGKCIGVTSIIEPAAGPVIGQQQLELAFHFFFEIAVVVE